MATILAILKALAAGWNVWKQERELHNRPEMVKAKTAAAIQTAKDRLSTAEAILANPNATPDQHAEALRQIRLAHS